MPSKRDFEKFYQSNIDKIFRFVMFRVGNNRELAEDLVSEIFMKALENFEDYDPKISKSAWIFAIAKNHLANYWRSCRPVESLPEEDEFLENKTWFELSVRQAEIGQEKREIYDILAKLEQDEREIVTFHYLLGYSYLEIAKMRGASEGSTKVAAHRAIKKLKNLI
jgi:RNA polymerase sigma-70 factor (ECF subfamily)